MSSMLTSLERRKQTPIADNALTNFQILPSRQPMEIISIPPDVRITLIGQDVQSCHESQRTAMCTKRILGGHAHK